MQTPTIDLDRIANQRGGTVTLNGVPHTVRPINAVTLQLMQKAQPEDYLAISLTVVERVVPSLDQAAREELIPAQLQAIVSIATGDVDAVAALDPNGASPATVADSPG